MQRLRLLLAPTVLLISFVALGAQNSRRTTPPTVAEKGTVQTVAAMRLRGRVADPTGAVIQGSSVKVMQGNDTIAEVTTGATGEFDVELPAGEYQIEVNTPDFKPFTEKVRVAAGMAPLTITLSLSTIEAKVDVNEAANQDVTIDSPPTLGAQTIAGDQLDDLPDNEDDLVDYLRRLAGTSGAAGLKPRSSLTDSPGDGFLQKIRFCKSSSTTIPSRPKATADRALQS